MAIYLDTNVIPRNGNLDALEFVIVQALARETGHELVVPELVLDEVESHYLRTTEGVFDVLRRAHRDARSFANVPLLPELPVPGDLAREFRRRLGEICAVAATPEGGAEEALRREAHRLRPAREGKGARDVAIWLAVKAAHEASGTDGFLLTQNTADFADPADRLRLHPDLLAEVAAGNLTLATSLEHLLELLAGAADVLIDEAFVLGHDECPRAIVRALHDANLDDLLADLGLEGAGPKRRSYLSGPVIPQLLAVHDSRGFEVEGRRVGVAWTRWSIFMPIGVLERSGGGASISGFEAPFEGSFQILVRVDGGESTVEAGGYSRVTATS